MKGKLRLLLTNKQDIVQPGRLLPHLANELNLTGKSTNGDQVKDCIAECLDELESDGLVTLVKRGKLYDEVHRTSRQRAFRSNTKQHKKIKSTEAAALAEPAVVSNREGAGEETSMSTAVIEPEQVVLADEKSGDENETALQIITRVTRSAKKFKAMYEEEVAAHTETKRCKASIETAKANLEKTVGERDRTIRKIEEDFSLLQAENTQLQVALSNGTTLLDNAESKLTEANARIAALEAEVASVKADRSGQILDLAAMIRSLDEPLASE